MSEKLPRVTANEMIKIVEKTGFYFIRQSGSHKGQMREKIIKAVRLKPMKKKLP